MKKNDENLKFMSYEEFLDDIKVNGILKKPNEWRKGQSVFNYIDIKYDVARYVQFVERIDCFYDDNQIDAFCTACYNKLKSNEG